MPMIHGSSLLEWETVFSSEVPLEEVVAQVAVALREAIVGEYPQSWSTRGNVWRQDDPMVRLLHHVQGRALASFLEHLQVSHQAMTVHSLLHLSSISSINHVSEGLLHGLAGFDTIACNLKVLLHQYHQWPQNKCDST